jgi:hypothetical protein
VLVAQAALVIARVASGEPVVQEALAGLAAQVAPVVPVVPAEQLAPVVPVVPAVRAAPVVLVVPAVRAAPVVLVAPVVQVAPAVRVALVVPVVPVVRVVQENPVAPELGTGPVVALELALVQVAVALRTKSVTTRPRRGRVAAPRVEDSAAAAETTREPVAAEAGRAWAVAE